MQPSAGGPGTGVRQVVPDALGDRCDAVIAAELARLDRRRPGLSPHQRRVIADVLNDLARQLVLRPVRSQPRHHHAVAMLFALPDQPTPAERGRS